MLRILVADDECAGGRPQQSLIRGAVVSYRAEQIDIWFQVVKSQGAQSCPRPFWATKSLRLAEPIGSRPLVDLGSGEPGKIRYPRDGCSAAEIALGCPGNP
jgi:hypothetical protein